MISLPVTRQTRLLRRGWTEVPSVVQRFAARSVVSLRTESWVCRRLCGWAVSFGRVVTPPEIRVPGCSGSAESRLLGCSLLTSRCILSGGGRRAKPELL